MQLRSTVVALIIAAAAGGSAVRVFGSRGSPDVPVAAHGSPDVTGAAQDERPGTASFAMTVPDPKLTAARASQRGASSGATAIVYVAGAVMRPGVYSLPASARANDALRAAGGAAPSADLVAVNLAARIVDGDEIAIPVRGASESVGSDLGSRVTRRRHSARARSASKAHRQRKHRTRAALGNVAGADDAGAPATEAGAPTDVVDVNAATEAELESLPGVGPALAERIVAFRDLNGPFASSDELLDVGGMTAAKVDALSPYVAFH